MLTVNNFSMLFFLLIFATFPKGIFLLSYLVGLNINDKVCTGTIIDWNIIATSANCFPALPTAQDEGGTDLEAEVSTQPSEGETPAPEAGAEAPPAEGSRRRSKRQEEFSDQTIEFNMEDLAGFKISYGVYTLGVGDVQKIILHGLAEKIDNLKHDLAIIALKDRLPEDRVAILPIDAEGLSPENGTETCTLKSIVVSTVETNSTDSNETSTGETVEYEQNAVIETAGCGCAPADSGFEARGIYCVQVDEKEQSCYGDKGSPLICGGKLTAVALKRYKCNPSDDPACDVKKDAIDLFMSVKQNLDWFNTLEIEGGSDDTKIGVGADVVVKASNANVINEKLIYPFLIIQIVHVFVLN